MAPRHFLQAGQKAVQRRARRVDGGQQGAQAGQVLDLERPLLTVRQAADKLALSSIKGVYHLIEKRGLPIRRLGRAIRIHEGELDAWTRQRRETGQVQTQPLTLVGSR